jgi:hypothetical protein
MYYKWWNILELFSIISYSYTCYNKYYRIQQRIELLLTCTSLIINQKTNLLAIN